MKTQLTLWALALVGSISAHAAAFAGLLPFLRPDPPPQQPNPQSSLTLASQQVSRSQAQERPVASEPGESIAAKGEALQAGTVPQTQARAAPAPTQSLSPHQPKPARLASTLPPQNTATATPPPASSIATTPVPLTNLTAAQPSTSAAAAMAPAPQALTPTSVSAQGSSISQATPSPEALVQTPPTPISISATLAFQGNETGEVDPLSLAAFQSFTRPEDLAHAATDLRDGLSELLSTVPCSRLQVAFDPDSATLELRGHLPEEGLRAPVLAALQAQMGRDITLSDQMRLLPRPQCGALSGIASVGLPQSTDQITNPLLLGPDAQARVLSYSGGEQLFFDLTAPDYPAYLYVDYFDAAGAVIHLSPNEAAPLNQAPAKSALRVGAKTPEEPGLLITVGPPYGQEIAVAFAASTPLYQGLRPLSEPAPAYLAFLREKIAQKRGQDSDFKGEWVYFLIETQAN